MVNWKDPEKKGTCKSKFNAPLERSTDVRSVFTHLDTGLINICALFLRGMKQSN